MNYNPYRNPTRVTLEELYDLMNSNRNIYADDTGFREGIKFLFYLRFSVKLKSMCKNDDDRIFLILCDSKGI